MRHTQPHAHRQTLGYSLCPETNKQTNKLWEKAVHGTLGQKSCLGGESVKIVAFGNSFFLRESWTSSDSLLWLAAKELLAHFGRTPTVICAGPQWDPSQPSFYKCPAPLELLRRLGDSALIFWNGGGNFGDVWRDIQLYRWVLSLSLSLNVSSEGLWKSRRTCCVDQQAASSQESLKSYDDYIMISFEIMLYFR